MDLDLKCVLRYVKLAQQDAVMQAGIDDIELIAGDVIMALYQEPHLIAPGVQCEVSIFLVKQVLKGTLATITAFFYSD